MTNEKKAAISTGYTMFPTMILLVTTTVLAYIMQAYPTVAPSTVALLMTIPSLVSTAVSFLVGFIANRVSHRLIVTFGMVCMFACGIIMYFGGGTAPFSLLIMGVVLLGIGMGCNSVMTGTIVSLHMPREKIGIIFISPCPSKVTYVKAPLGTEKSQVDKVLAIKDVYPKLLACMKAVGREEYPSIGTAGKIGISWGHSGGEASGLFTESYLAADGIENVIRVLEDMEDQKFTNLRFVELNACNGGCVGCVLTVENPYVAEVKLKRLRKYMPVARTHIDELSQQIIPWTTGVQYEPVFSLGNTMMESFSRLNQVERLMKKFPGLDCGSCGAPTCKALAEDIVRGEANESDCVYYLRENLHKLSEEVSLLAEDLVDGGIEKQEPLKLIKEYIGRISEEMSLLDKKEGEKHDRAGTDGDGTLPDGESGR